MTMKKIFATILAIALAFAINIPALATSYGPMDRLQENIVDVEEGDGTEHNPDNSLPKPEDEPPEFRVEFFHGGNGYKLMGYFTGYTHDMTYVETFYSFDGENYQPIDEIFAWGIPEDTSEVENPKALIADQGDSPLREYLAREEDSVYIRLHYKTKDGAEGISQVYSIIRPTQPSPLPEGIEVSTRYAKNTQMGMRPIYQYNITVRQETTIEELSAMLPSTLPIRVQLTNSERLLADINVECAVEWNLPESLEEETEVVMDGIKSVTPPPDIVIDALDSLYIIDEFPPMTVKLKLIINRVEVGATFALHSQQQGGDWDTLDATFPLKPSGATAIIPYYSLDGGDTWIETADLLSYNSAVEAFPRSPDYNFATLFTPEQSPFKEFAAGELDGFLVKFNIIGGVFNGMSEVTPWPMEYNYEPPDKDNGTGGSGGNENNAGSDDDDEDEDDHGQRPTIPEGKPIVEPPTESTDLPSEIIPPLPPETELQPEPVPNPEQPSLPEAGTDKTEIKELGTIKNSGGERKAVPPVGGKEQVDKTENPPEAVTEITVSQKRTLDYFDEAQTMGNFTESATGMPQIAKQKQHDNGITQLPERGEKEEKRLPKGATGLLLTGGVAAVGVTAGLKGKVAGIGVISRIISAIKGFLAR